MVQVDTNLKRASVRDWLFPNLACHLCWGSLRKLFLSGNDLRSSVSIGVCLNRWCPQKLVVNHQIKFCCKHGPQFRRPSPTSRWLYNPLSPILYKVLVKSEPPWSKPLWNHHEQIYTHTYICVYIYAYGYPYRYLIESQFIDGQTTMKSPSDMPFPLPTDDRAYGGNGHDQLIELQAVQHRGLPLSIQAHHDDLALLEAMACPVEMGEATKLGSWLSWPNNWHGYVFCPNRFCSGKRPLALGARAPDPAHINLIVFS